MWTRHVKNGQGPQELLRVRIEAKPSQPFCFSNQEKHCLGAWMKYLLWIMKVFIMDFLF